MKRLFVVFGIMAVMLTGCADDTSTKDLALKEKCEGHTQQAQNLLGKTIEPEYQSLVGSTLAPVATVKQISFSKKLNSCILVERLQAYSGETTYFKDILSTKVLYKVKLFNDKFDLAAHSDSCNVSVCFSAIGTNQYNSFIQQKENDLQLIQ